MMTAQPKKISNTRGTQIFDCLVRLYSIYDAWLYWDMIQHIYRVYNMCV